MQTRKTLGLLAVVVVLTLALSAFGAKEEPLYPVGSLSMEATTVAAGLGFNWGDGILKFKGKEVKFKVKGLDVAAVGISKVTATGDVYNLQNVSDLAGTYTQAGAGIALAGGVKGMLARNQKGVVIDLKAVQQGVQFNLGVGGFTIEMAK